MRLLSTSYAVLLLASNPPRSRWASVAPRASTLAMLARRRARRSGPKLPPRVMQRVPSGVPEIAQTHPERYDELLQAKTAALESMLGAAAGEEVLPPTEVFESAPAVSYEEAFRRKDEKLRKENMVVLE